jgi:hypothetical protein
MPGEEKTLHWLSLIIFCLTAQLFNCHFSLGVLLDGCTASIRLCLSTKRPPIYTVVFERNHYHFHHYHYFKQVTQVANTYLINQALLSD